MSTCVTVPFWPACLDNLQWSQDNLIALAGSESIAILVPRLKEKAAGEARWAQIIIRVNTFSLSELPLLQALSFEKYSPAEEVSPRLVIALSWSLPGLGNFAACALAILHSDYSLVLWEYQGRADVRDNWRRCLIISTAIRRYYDTVFPLPAAATWRDLEQRQVRGRIRSFVWAPRTATTSIQELNDWADDIVPGTNQLLAVSTEAGDILLVRITSPYNILAKEKVLWRATVVHRIVCSSHLTSLNRADIWDYPYKAGYPVIEHLLWTYNIQFRQHALAFIVDNGLHTVYCDFPDAMNNSNADSDLRTTMRQITNEDTLISGPLKASPDGSMLLCFSDDALVSFAISKDSSASSSFDYQTLRRNWSEMSGLAVMSNTTDSVRAFPVTQLAYEDISTVMMTVPSSNGAPGPEPAQLQLVLRESMKSFKTKHELSGGVHTRTWGVAASPTYNSVAICSSMVPADSVVHVISSRESCDVIICDQAQLEAIVTAPIIDTLQHPHIEPVLFDVRSRRIAVRRDPETTGSASDSPARSMHDLLVGAMASQTATVSKEHLAFAKESATVSAVLALRASVLWRPDRISDVQSRLRAQFDEKPYTTLLPNDWYLALTEEVHTIAKSLSKGRLSMRILHALTIVQSKIMRQDLSHDDELYTSTGEACSVCNEQMLFEALRWARCSSGHRFVRCALTFLAITEQGSSKACSLCGAQYLNEQRLAEFGNAKHSANGSGNGFSRRPDELMRDANGDTSLSTSDLPVAEPVSSLARVLFAVFDRCVLCNGTFTV